jgi:hypothetical protein
LRGIGDSVHVESRSPNSPAGDGSVIEKILMGICH